MNRAQRRSKLHIAEPPVVKLKDWIESDEVARRSEVWEVCWRAIALNEKRRRLNRPWNRLIIYIRTLISGEPVVIDPQTGKPQKNES